MTNVLVYYSRCVSRNKIWNGWISPLASELFTVALHLNIFRFGFDTLRWLIQICIAYKSSLASQRKALKNQINCFTCFKTICWPQSIHSVDEINHIVAQCLSIFRSFVYTNRIVGYVFGVDTLTIAYFLSVFIVMHFDIASIVFCFSIVFLHLSQKQITLKLLLFFDSLKLFRYTIFVFYTNALRNEHNKYKINAQYTEKNDLQQRKY